MFRAIHGREAVHGFNQPDSKHTFPKSIGNVSGKARVARRSHPLRESFASIFDFDRGFVAEQGAQCDLSSVEIRVGHEFFAVCQNATGVRGAAFQWRDGLADRIAEFLVGVCFLQALLQRRPVLDLIHVIRLPAKHDGHAVGEGCQLVEVLLSNGLERMIVTLCTFDASAKKQTHQVRHMIQRHALVAQVESGSAIDPQQAFRSDQFLDKGVVVHARPNCFLHPLVIGPTRLARNAVRIKPQLICFPVKHVADKAFAGQQLLNLFGAFVRIGIA